MGDEAGEVEWIAVQGRSWPPPWRTLIPPARQGIAPETVFVRVNGCLPEFVELSLDRLARVQTQGVSAGAPFCGRRR